MNKRPPDGGHVAKSHNQPPSGLKVQHRFLKSNERHTRPITLNRRWAVDSQLGGMNAASGSPCHGETNGLRGAAQLSGG